MKMEERERIIRDEGKQIGIINGKIESVLELLEDKGEVPEKVSRNFRRNGSGSIEEVAAFGSKIGNDRGIL